MKPESRAQVNTHTKQYGVSIEHGAAASMRRVDRAPLVKRNHFLEYRTIKGIRNPFRIASLFICQKCSRDYVEVPN